MKKIECYDLGRRPFADSKWYQKVKQQILQGLRRGTSLRLTEELSVEKDSLNLQIGVMTDMVASSTNPSVSAIANTSLAALYTSLSEQTAPNCCNASAAKQLHQLKREFSNPGDLHSATLLARVIASERKSSKMSLSEENEGLKSIMRCILALPDIQIAKMHAWQYNQLWEALSWCKELYSPDEQEELLSTMLDRLLQSGEPTLQQDLIVSHGQYKTEKLLMYLSEIGVDFSDYHTKKKASFNSDNVNYFYEDSNSLFKPLVKALKHVYQLLFKSLDDADAKWTIDPLLRLTVISKLHDVVQHDFDQDSLIKDTETLLHWLLLIILKGHGCPGSASLHEYDLLSKHLLDAMFPGYEGLDDEYRSTVCFEGIH